MINTHRILFTLGLLLLAGLLCAQAPLPTLGTASRPGHNKRDIAHRSNAALREQLMQEAVADAIDHVAPMQVRSVTRHQVGELRRDDRSSYKESFQQKSMQTTDVRWMRTGPFRFQRDEPTKGWWTCTVSGTVQTLNEPAKAPTLANASEPLTVDHRKGDRLWVSWMGPRPAIAVGERLESSSDKGTRIGHAVVTAVDDQGLSARIIKGHWAVRSGDELRSGKFPLLNGGVRVRWGSSMECPTPTSNITAEYKASRVATQGPIIEVYERSLVEHWELRLGVELMRTTDSLATNATFLYFGVARPITLIPELLHLVPALDPGIALTGEDVYLGSSALPLFATGSVEAQLQLGAVELNGALRYRAMMGGGPFSGAQITMGLGLDLYRITGTDTGARSRPGLSNLFHHVQSPFR